MRVKIMGANERLRLIFKLVVYWSIGIVIFLAGTFYGRKLERVCWEQALVEVSQEYQTLDTLEKIIVAESSGRHEGIYGRAGEYGLAQFTPGTFFWLADKMGLESPDWKSWEDQVVILNWAIRNGYASKHWSTYRQIEK